MSAKTPHLLRAPVSDEEWRTYHAIRRLVLFESRGLFGVYDENHPDTEGCRLVRIYSAPDAAGFYEKCGYHRDASEAPPPERQYVLMAKHMTRIPGR